MDVDGDAAGASRKPAYVTALEAAYGAPSQVGFGSAVFVRPAADSDALERAAQACYRYFVGDNWEAWGEAVWMATWKEVYRRPDTPAHDVVSELAGIVDPVVGMQVDMILNVVDNAVAARAL